jgi:hypothetical protein
VALIRLSLLRMLSLAGCAILLSGCLCLSQAATTSTPAKTTAKKSTTHKKSHRRKARGQQNIDPKRIREIQEALVREHYLSGKPSGKWDAATQNALVRYQGANGWQTKVVPDSRALIKLGLGPSHDRLLNPESAMTTVPAQTSQQSSTDESAASDAKSQ